MRLASEGIICVDGSVNQPLIGKGIDLYQVRLINYYAMLQLRNEVAGTATSRLEQLKASHQQLVERLARA